MFQKLDYKLLKGIILLALMLFAATSCIRTPVATKNYNPANDTFYQALESLQGARVIGQPLYPETKSTLFAGQLVSLEVINCTKSEMRIPIYIGEKVYRTLILERTPAGFFLKHENKQEDGQANRINLYGGHTKGNGTAYMQFFPADTYTKNLMNLSTPCVWTLAFSSDHSTFSYLVENNGKLELQIDFNLNNYLAATAGKWEQRSKR
ncbi:hypothetical protein [Adhaeribacter pallidiroseus]|uniref:Lipoprotein n=1 Tax=Adhaeribacter pallidiroseus TaxID=2072847 RepID=A0A369QQH2_9BACT|nr:hypothetical protein [Adhaeribacter pallidiroseus]RDC65099.1 hypothetical protein AHMF7616_03723 [Adhaeribacter pallidiroseus]